MSWETDVGLARVPALTAVLTLLAAGALQTAEALHGQSPVVAGAEFVNSDGEQYLRVLQGRGLVPAHFWSVRPFSPAQVQGMIPRDSIHPWAGRVEPVVGPGRVAWITPEARFIHNSAFPYGTNEGAVWAGKGVTAAVQGGFAAELGPISLLVAPVAFWAQNADFEPADNHYEGRLRFAEEAYPTTIDLPQRFGASAYARVDPGQSTLSIQALGVTAGISTANQHWGPARDQPLMLGNNAPGFLHGFLGSAEPVNLWIGRAHGRLLIGRLTQSAYSAAEGAAAKREMNGLVLGFSPRFLPHLEIGMGRFFHDWWPDGGVRGLDLLRPFESIYASGADNADENQLANAFARWVLPESGMEVYGEYLRDDFTWGFRDLLLFPDQNAGYVVGFLKSWARAPREWLVIRGEVLNARSSPTAPEGYHMPLYIHSGVPQGHTQRGQLLGSLAAFRGAGSVLGVDLYDPNGRWSAEWTRTTRLHHADAAPEVTAGADAIHVLGIEAVRFRGPAAFSAEIAAVYNFNRHLRSDALNVRSSVSVRWRL